MSPGMETPAVIVGGGQAGLAVSHELTEAGVEHVVLEGSGIGQTWRRRWDRLLPRHAELDQGPARLPLRRRRSAGIRTSRRGRRLPGALRSVLRRSGPDRRRGPGIAWGSRRRVPPPRFGGRDAFTPGGAGHGGLPEAPPPPVRDGVPGPAARHRRR